MKINLQKLKDIEIRTRIKDRNFKNKVFISKISIKIKNTLLKPIRWVQHTHDILKQVDAESLLKDTNPNIYEMFFGWILDVLQFGILCLVCISAFMGWQNLAKNVMLVFGFGVIPSIIGYLRKTLKGEK